MTRLALLVLTTSLAVGCGYTKEEYQLQGDKLTRALAKQRAAETRSDEIAAELETAKLRVADLEDKMRALGIDLTAKDGQRIGEVAATLAERERALAEYRARATKIDELRARRDLLRAKLADHAAAGVEVRVRRNRLAIVLPDSLFDKDKPKKEGKAAIAAIAAAIKDDPTLATRDFQVGGHSDDKGGKGADAIGATTARARAVLGQLLEGKDGGLDRKRFSVAGFGDADPVAPNDNDDNRKLNRRVEIVLVPAQSEMLDLRALALDPGPAKPAQPKPAPAPPAPGPAPAPAKPAPKPAPTAP